MERSVTVRRKDAMPWGDLVEKAKALKPILGKYAARRDAEREYPLDEMRLIVESGIPSARIERSRGGPELSFVQLADVLVHVATADPNIAQMLQPHLIICEWIRLEGSPEQKSKFLGEAVKGAFFSNGFAERGTKFVGETRTTLVRDGPNYRLSGTKFFSTGSYFADYMLSNAIRDDGVFVLAVYPKSREGVRIADDWDGMGQRTTASGTTELENVLIHPDEVIALPRFGKQRTLVGTAAQLPHVAIDVGIACAALSDAIAYCKTRARPIAGTGVQSASEDPYVIYAVGEMNVMVHAAETMLRRGAEFLDTAARAQIDLREGEVLEKELVEASIAVAEAKVVATNACLQATEMMYRVGGASMALRTYNYDRHWRNARTHTLHDPVTYKYHAVGEFYLNGKNPMISMKL